MLKLLAQQQPISDFYLPGQKLGGSAATIGTLVSPLIRNVLVLTVLASVILVVIAGFNFVTSAGDKSKTQQATNMITYGLIGLVLAIAAFTITQIMGKIGGFDLLNPPGL